MNKRLSLLLLTAAIFTGSLFAQRDLGAITGTVTDVSGAVVAGAKINITEQATGVRFSAVTDASGTYIRPLLKAGTYTLEIQATGFRKAIQKDIQLTGGDRVGVNIQLTVGEMTEIAGPMTVSLLQYLQPSE